MKRQNTSIKAPIAVGLALLSFGLVMTLNSCKKESSLTAQKVDSSTQKRSTEEVSHPSVAAKGSYIPNEVLVRFKSNIGEDRRAQALQNMNAEVIERIHTNAMKRSGDRQGVYLVRMPIDVPRAMNRWRSEQNDAIEYVEPNFVYSYGAVSNDQYYTNGQLWGMYSAAGSPSNQFGSQAATAWANNNTGSANVIIAVIDEGMMNEHDDLTANCWVNPHEIQ